MSLGEYLGGLAFFAGTWGGVGAAVAVLARRRLGSLGGAPLAVACGLLFVAGLIAVHLLPMALGALTRGTVLAAGGLALAGALLVPADAAEPRASAAAPEPGARASWTLAALAAGAVGVVALAYLKQVATVSAVGIDFTTFHLPVVAEWVQTGTVWQHSEFVPGYPLGTYPNNGDVVFLAALLPWRNDAFVRLVEFPLLGLVGLSAYATARELRAPATAAVAIAALVVATPAIAQTALDRVKPDAMMLAALGAGMLFLLRHCRTRARGDLVLGGLGLGLAFGARWNAMAAVAVVAVAWTAATWAARHDLRSTLADGARLAGMVAAGGGFWLVRNLAVTGNPVHPQRVEAFGVVLFDGPPDVVRVRFGHSISDYLGDWDVLRHVVAPDWREALAAPTALLGLLALAGAILALRAPRSPAGARRGALLALAGAAAAMLAVYVVAPSGAHGFAGSPFPHIVHENARWAAPALLMAAPVAAWAAGRLGRWRVAVEALCVVAVVDGLARGFDLSRGDLAIGLAAALVLALALRAGVARRPLGRAATVGVAAAVAVTAAVVGYDSQERFNDKRYRGLTPTIDWVAANAPEGRRIGLAGGFAVGPVAPILPMFGPRLRNQVEFVGPLRRDMLGHHRTRSAYRAALRRGRYDLLLVGRGVVPRDGTRTERWTLEAGWVPVARSATDVLYRRPRR